MIGDVRVRRRVDHLPAVSAEYRRVPVFLPEPADQLDHPVADCLYPVLPGRVDVRLSLAHVALELALHPLDPVAQARIRLAGFHVFLVLPDQRFQFLAAGIQLLFHLRAQGFQLGGLGLALVRLRDDP